MKRLKKIKNLKNVLSCTFLAIASLIVGYTIWIPGDKVGENSNPIAVYLEQDDGSYQLSDENKIHHVGYLLNTSKSSCINGSTISASGGTGVSINFVGSDSCQIYYSQRSADLTMSNIIVDGVSSTNFPTNSNYNVTPVCSGATASWNYNSWSLEISDVASASVSCSITFTSNTNLNYLNDFIINNSGTTQGATAEAGQIVNENGYRYEGSNPYNYVLYNNELWRIIGVFETTLADGTTKQNLTKIIRNQTIGGYAIHETGNAYWENTSGIKAPLNNLLNEYYFNKKDGTNSSYCYAAGIRSGHPPIRRVCDLTASGLTKTYRNMVQNITWHLGGSSSATNPNEMYISERGTTIYDSLSSPTSTGYVGLMYPSDYGYSALGSSCDRTTALSAYNTTLCAGSAWLLNTSYEWTVTPASEQTYFAIYGYTGKVDKPHTNRSAQVRPVVYLKSGVFILSGEGTIGNPYIIGLH